MSGLERTHVLVLAAGRGTRMGGPKALMVVGGRVWWRYQHERLEGHGLDATWVVSPEVRQAMVDSGGGSLRFAEADPTAPMFASVLAGLDSLRGSPPDSVFILPVDCPVPSRGVWVALAATGAAAVPTWAGASGHPVHLPWAAVESIIDCVVRATPQASQAELRLDRIFEGVARHAAVEDPGVRVNLNTPADFAGWLADGTRDSSWQTD